MKKEYLIAGGVGVIALAAYFLLGKKDDELIPTGGSSYGSSGGYEGGGGGGDISYLFGGDTINFPAQEPFDLSAFLGGAPQTESNDLRYARGGDVIAGMTLKKPFVTAVLPSQSSSSSSSPAIAQATSKEAGIGETILGTLLNAVFVVPISGMKAGAAISSAVGSTKSGSGISSGSSSGIMKKPFVVGNTGTGWYTSSGGGKTYNQANPGAPGSGYVIRGYSLTGKPLYKPG